MNLKNYFENTTGTGVLATADSAGRVGTAIYSRPHEMEDGTVAFIMADRLAYRNLQSNGHASYLFHEEGPGYKGLRLSLTKVREEMNSDLLYSLRRKEVACEEAEDERSLFLVFFSVDKVLPLVGSGIPEESDATSKA